MADKLLVLAAVASLLPATSRAQSLASPFSVVGQTVDSTTIMVEYYRPSVRGRRIFGGLIHWGELWTPGANWATTLEVNRDVRIEGQLLPAGKYSLWFIPAAPPEAWTVVVNRAARRFHVAHADPKDDQLRFTVAPDSGPQQELLTFSFPTVSREGATLAFGWATTVLPMRVDVISSRRRTVPAHPLSSYTGVYSVRFHNDSMEPAVLFEIRERDEGLWVQGGSAVAEAGLDPNFDLLPAGGDDFYPRQYKNGTLIGDNLDELISFTLEGDHATRFEIRGLAEDKVLARGTLVRR